MEIIGIIFWVVLCFVVLAVANSKGRSGCGWFFLSLIISPLLALIIVALIGDSDEKKQEELKATAETIKKELTPEESQPATEKTEQDKAIEELKRAKDLLDLGVITQEEFDAKKAELLPLLTGESK